MTRASQIPRLSAALPVIGRDRVTKHIAERMLADEPDRPFLADTFAWTAVFTVLTAAALLVLAKLRRVREAPLP
jgi:hypothetical protein